MSGRPAIEAFKTRAEAAARTAEIIERALAEGLAARGRASLMLSGGSTPGPAYEALSESPLDWADVTVGLVDERWVAADDPASNAGLVGRTLLKSRAAAATFLPMTTDAATPQEAAQDVDARYRAAPWPLDAIVLGLGPDGHTASWFPGARGLEAALDPAGEALVSAIDATGAAVAGDHPLRMTLTLAAVNASRRGALLMFGEEKKAVLDRALDQPASDLPVRAALDALGDRLTVVWAD